MESIQLPVAQRAAAALGTPDYEKNLRQLAGKHTALTVITNDAGYRDCHSARMELKNVRVELEKRGKAAREDAQAFSKAVIAEEKRLIGLIEPEERRLQKLQDEWDADRQAERQAAIKAEQERVSAIHKRMLELEVLPAGLVGKSAAEIAEALNQLRAHEPATWAQEKVAEARALHLAILRKVEQMHEATVKAEAEAKRLADERAHLERERQAQEAKRIEEEHRARQAREKAEAEERERLARIAEEERASRARMQEDERKAREERAAEQARLDAERKRLDEERRKVEDEQRRLREAEEAKAAAERRAEEDRQRAKRLRLEEEQRAREAEERKAREEAAERARELLRQQNEIIDGRQMLQTFLERFGHREEFALVVVSIRSTLEELPVPA